MITTGPGLIRPIATASTNCCSVSQWWSSTRPWCRNGTIASPEPNVKAPAFAKKRPSAPSEAPDPVQAKHRGDYRQRRDARRTAQSRQAAAVVDCPERAGQQEEPDDLGARDD